ncbi:tRNA pseudouridine(38-40) synthase [Bradyrhizobium sp. F1.13.1]
MPACMRAGQVAHVDIDKQFPQGRFRDGLNAHLRPHPIAVLEADIVPETFEARFSAIKRHYRYRIVNTRANLALDAGHAWRVPRRLDADAMHAAAQRLLGKHDFTTFRDTECQARSPEKTLDQLDVLRDGREITILTSARSFLHSQVRSMVGSLMWVGEGRWTAEDLSAALAARKPRRLRHRRPAGRTVSDAGGLLERDAGNSRRAHHCHSPRRRGIQYAAASRINDCCLGLLDRPVKPGDDSGVWAGRRAYPKYRVKIPRYTLVSCSRSLTGTRSSTWCMVWPTRPNSITGQ